MSAKCKNCTKWHQVCYNLVLIERMEVEFCNVGIGVTAVGYA